MKILKPNIDYIGKIDEEISKIKNTITKQFLEKHDFMLTDQEKEFIKENPNYQAKEFIQKSPNLQKYLSCGPFCILDPFQLGACEIFNKTYDDEAWINLRKKDLQKWGIDTEKENIDIQDGEACLNRIGFFYVGEDGFTYRGISALDKMKEEFKDYSQLYVKQKEQYYYFVAREELSLQVRKMIEKQSTVPLNSKALQEIMDGYFAVLPMEIKNNKVGLFVQIDYDNHDCKEDPFLIEENFAIVSFCWFQLLNIKNNSIIENILYTMSHEIGHLIALSKKGNKYITGLHTRDEYTYLNEIMNDYINERVFSRLCQNDYIKDGNGIRHIQDSSYRNFFFLLDPFMTEYGPAFKKATMENNPELLIECMGLETFENYIQLINQYYASARENEEQFLSEEMMNRVKNKVDEILLAVREKNKQR